MKGWTTQDIVAIKRKRALQTTQAATKTPRGTKYAPKVVEAFYVESGLPVPYFEYRFHPERKWRFDMAWPNYMVYLECDGGIFIQGRHSQGAAMLKEWEKLNTAAGLGWRILFCQPSEVCMTDTVELIRKALEWSWE